MTDKTTHKPGCEALGGYGHGIGPCSCSKAQPEALRLAEFFESLTKSSHRWWDGVPVHEKAATVLRAQLTEIQQLKAQLTTQTNRAAAAEQQVTALTQRLDMANRLNTDAREELARMTEKNAWLEDEMRSQCNIHGIAAEREATRMTQNQRMHERIAELEAQLKDRGDYFYGLGGNLQVFGSHQSIKALKAQLSARQAAPDEALRDALVRARDWFESQAKVVSKGCGSPWNLMQLRDERDAADAALSAAPPPPEREPLTDEQIARAAVNAGMKPIYDKPKKPMVNALGSSVPFTWLKAFAHGIGATND